jgi:hypothetical protein
MLRKLDPRITLKTEYGTFEIGYYTYNWKTTWSIEMHENDPETGTRFGNSPKSTRRRATKDARKKLKHFKQVNMV